MPENLSALFLEELHASTRDGALVELVTVVSEERNGSISLSTIPIERFYRARGQNAVLSLSLSLSATQATFTPV